MLAEVDVRPLRVGGTQRLSQKSAVAWAVSVWETFGSGASDPKPFFVVVLKIIYCLLLPQRVEVKLNKHPISIH